MEVSENNRRTNRRSAYAIGNSKIAKWKIVRTRHFNVGSIRVRIINKVIIVIERGSRMDRDIGRVREAPVSDRNDKSFGGSIKKHGANDRKLLQLLKRKTITIVTSSFYLIYASYHHWRILSTTFRKLFTRLSSFEEIPRRIQRVSDS